MRAWRWSWRPSSSLTGGSLLRACGRARSRRSSSSSAGWSRNCVFRSSRRSCAPRSLRRSSVWRNSGRLCANEHRTFAVVRRRQPAASPHAVADVMADADRARHLGHCGNRAMGARCDPDCLSAAALARNGDVLSELQPRLRHPHRGARAAVPRVRASGLPHCLFILGIFDMQAMVDHVARRSFPDLERRRGGGVAGSGWNGLVALFGMLGLGVLALPLWLLPPLWPLIPVAILAWGNQRLLRYDALAEHADPAEMARIFRERRGGLYLLGLQLALLAYVPILGLFAPVIFGLAFIYYLLDALQAARQHD